MFRAMAPLQDSRESNSSLIHHRILQGVDNELFINQTKGEKYYSSFFFFLNVWTLY